MGREYEVLRLHLARNIKTLRGKQDLSQEQLALAAELDRTYVSQMERAVGNPSLLVLWKLAEVLGVDASALLSAPPAARRKAAKEAG